MRLLVVSDSHGAARQLISLCKSLENIDGLIHAGDGERDILELHEKMPELPIYAVHGNCDYGKHSFLDELCFSLGGVEFFLAHGHNFGVKYGYDALLSAAQKHGAQVAIFGHTHRPLCEYIEGLWLMNPGSLVMNYTGKLLTGFVDINNGAVVCHTAAIDYK